ncbi:hypothetical protein MO973_06905 [Paenibacillus sp. TRM 82003]|nr:hypothetical protein [Paenibacillus sp. TRM 82003]
MMPQPRGSLRRGIRPLLTFLLVLGLVGGALTLYLSTEPKLDWSYGEMPSLGERIETMIAERSLSLTITEAELNALVKAELFQRRALAEGIELSGADAALDDDVLTVRTDVTMGGRLRAQLTHRLRLAWEEPELVATHESTKLKDIPLPASWFRIGEIRVPLGWEAAGVPIRVDRASFEAEGIRLQLRLANPLF